MFRLLLLLAITVATSHADSEGFVPLFPKDGPPAGFIVRHWADVSQPPQEAAAWEVREGVLTSVGARGCWLLSEKEYSNFVLEYEFKLGPRGNSGCALRAPASGDPAFEGMEMQMADFRYNEQARESELTGGIYRAAPPARQLYKPEEWNKVRITLNGSHLNVVLNGETIQELDLGKFHELVPRHDGSMASPLRERPRAGRIGFQELSRGGSHTLIREARIKELPAS
ncbi:MAG: DUF1080 domain-containing protein [Verrucomicrobiota bacterium]